MANPFLQRATEYIRDDAAFLAVVSPQPLTTFLTKHPRKEDLFRLPVRILGSPGSGKTMLATLAEFRLIEAILRDQSNDANRELAAALADAGGGDQACGAARHVHCVSEGDRKKLGGCSAMCEMQAASFCPVAGTRGGVKVRKEPLFQEGVVPSCGPHRSSTTELS